VSLDPQRPPPTQPRGSNARGLSARAPAITLTTSLLLLLLIGWGAGELVSAWAGSSDLDAVRDLASARTRSLTAAAHALSLVGSGYIIFPLALTSSLLLLRVHRRAAALTVALGTFGAVAIANTDKLLVDRPRPPVHHLEQVTSASFPSGHAAQSTAFLVALLVVLFHSAAPRRARVPPPAAAAALLTFGSRSRVSTSEFTIQATLPVACFSAGRGRFSPRD
jgi:membrane-associated phospholipid phosphatase